MFTTVVVVFIKAKPEVNPRVVFLVIKFHLVRGLHRCNRLYDMNTPQLHERAQEDWLWTMNTPALLRAKQDGDNWLEWSYILTAVVHTGCIPSTGHWSVTVNNVKVAEGSDPFSARDFSRTGSLAIIVNKGFSENPPVVQGLPTIQGPTFAPFLQFSKKQALQNEALLCDLNDINQPYPRCMYLSLLLYGISNYTK